MELFQTPILGEPSPCSYLPDRVFIPEYFLAAGLSAGELAPLLASGWRKFGPYFFRPACPDCRQCIPLRVEVSRFRPSASQRRVLRRNRDLEVRAVPLDCSEEGFALYQAHSRARFGQETDREGFVASFYRPSCPGLQLELRLGGKLLGLGILDLAGDGLSSVYFCFDPDEARRNLGTFGALQEIGLARRLGLAWYYLGYFVPGSPRMAYKDHFRPRQHMDWGAGTWREVDAPPAELTFIIRSNLPRRTI